MIFKNFENRLPPNDRIKAFDNKKSPDSDPADDGGITRRDALKAIAAGLALVSVGINPNKIAEEKEIPLKTAKPGSQKLGEKNKENAEKPARKTGQEKIKGFDAKQTADDCLTAYIELSKNRELWPPELFSDDFMLAMTAQESAGKIDAVSVDDAVGVLQVTPIAIQDVIFFLNRLMRSGRAQVKVPKEITEEQARAIQEMIKIKSDYGRAFGKIYLMRIWDKQHGFGMGRKHLSGKKMNDNSALKKARTEIAAFYNAGKTVTKLIGKQRYLKPRVLWPKETRDYCKYIDIFQDMIIKIRRSFAANHLKLSRRDENFAVSQIINSQKWPKTRLHKLKEKDFNGLAKAILEDKKKKEDNREAFNHEDIKMIVNG